MGHVFKARQLSLGRLVAIKVLRPELADDPSTLSQFKLEANAVANLKHPNILQIHEAGEVQGLHYFSMEYVSGYSVAAWLHRSGPLSEKDAFLVIESIAQALKYAWEKGGLVHCDIKPDNIMVDEDGLIKLADFSGISLTNRSQEMELLRNVTIGTPNYMAPEQVEGEYEVDCRVDIYAIGALLYNLLTGEVPFASHDPETVMEQQVQGHLKDPATINPAIQPATVMFVERLMVKDRAARYGSWEDVLFDLSRVRAGHPPVGEPPPIGASTVYRTTPAPKPPKADLLRADRGRGFRSITLPHGGVQQHPAPLAKKKSHTRVVMVVAFIGLIVLNLFLFTDLFKPKPSPERPVDRPGPGPVERPGSVTPRPVERPPTPPPEDFEIPGLPPPVVPPEPVKPVEPVPETPSVPTEVKPPAPPGPGPVPPPAEDPAVRSAKFKEYLLMMDEVMRYCQRRQYAAAASRLGAWKTAQAGTPYAAKADVQLERVQKVVGLFELLSRDGSRLRGVELTATSGISGTITQVRDGKVGVMRKLGSGMAAVEIELVTLGVGDLLNLLRTLDPDHALQMESALLIAESHTAAAAKVREAENARMDATALRAWLDDWQAIQFNLAADRRVDEIKALAAEQKFVAAEALLSKADQACAETEVFRWARTEELGRLRKSIAEGLARQEAPKPAPTEPSVPPGEGPGDGVSDGRGERPPAPVGDGSDFSVYVPPVVSPGAPSPVPVPRPALPENVSLVPPVDVSILSLKVPAKFQELDGQVVALRFRTRGNLVQRPDGMYNMEMRSEEGFILGVVPSGEAYEWAKNVSGGTARTEPSKVVYGRVDAAGGFIKLLGTRANGRPDGRHIFRWW